MRRRYNKYVQKNIYYNNDRTTRDAMAWNIRARCRAPSSSNLILYFIDTRQ